MITNNYTILAPQGMHARPATALIKLVKGFKSDISIQKGDKMIRLNTILGLLSLNIRGGETITVTIEGEDQATAETAVNQFFNEQLKDL